VSSYTPEMSDHLSELAFERPARRFLHICYCCDDASAVSDFFVNGLAMRNTMQTTDEYSSGAILGLDYQVRSVGSFVYDKRGPRTSPAVEVQGWYDPTPVGTPSVDPFEIGIKALGFAVPSIDQAVATLTELGCAVQSDGPSPYDERIVTLIDSRGVMLELVENPSLDAEATQMDHLRITVVSLAESLPFYDMLGFEVTERGNIADGTFVGLAGFVDGEYVRMRLPDEPFEVRLIEWRSPVGHGRHYTEPYHAGIFRAALGVDDTRVSYAAMSAAGAVFDRPPMEVELSGTPVPDMWITFISDPNGIPYEFVQRPRSAFR
jgi:catechol 2,3-dioxygenase-like lactoylglutathione lyase family enzyme